jgi:hypothetical protein
MVSGVKYKQGKEVGSFACMSSATIADNEETEARRKYGGIGPWIFIYMYYFSMEEMHIILVLEGRISAQFP